MRHRGSPCPPVQSAIAGRQTGVYPVASPGGWQIIGRTPVRLFDPARTPPARLVPGTRVRFVPVTVAEFEAHDRGGRLVTHLVVRMPGLMTTVQDLGRWGHQAVGVPVGGAMDTDPIASRTRWPATRRRRRRWRSRSPARARSRGAGHHCARRGRHRGLGWGRVWRPPVARRRRRRADHRASGRRHSGARAYLAVAGGIDTPEVLGSRAADLRSGFPASRAARFARAIACPSARPRARGARRARAALAPARARRRRAARAPRAARGSRRRCSTVCVRRRSSCPGGPTAWDIGWKAARSRPCPAVTS